MKVLVTDDSDISRQLAKGILEGSGHSVTESESGERTLQLLNEGFEPDVLLMDIRMPGLDGFETAAKIRQREADENLERLPLIALTSFAYKGYGKKCLDAGMDGYLTKPIDEGKMFEILRMLTTGPTEVLGAD